MNGEAWKERLTRRGFLGVGSAAVAGASLLSAKSLVGQEQETPQKAKTDRSASDPGPTNSALDAANPDSNNPIISDAGGVQTFKYPFSFAHKRFQEGGWSREVTVRELAVAHAGWVEARTNALQQGGLQRVLAGVETGIRLTTPDADAAHAALLAHGVDASDVLRWPGVPPMFSFRDLDGNGLELVQQA